MRRFEAWKRLGRIRGYEPGLPPPEIYGIKISKTGEFTIDDLTKINY